MPTLHDYGHLLLASRLRKVSEALFDGVDEVYREQGVELSSRCFAILFLLRDHGRLGISEIATSLGQTHPAVSQMSRKLLAHELIREWPDRRDDRRRLLGLSRPGAALMRRLAATFEAIDAAVAALESRQPLSSMLTAVDAALGERSFAKRIRTAQRAREAAAVEIIPFESRYRADFKRLNLEWLQRYFRVEPIDEEVLSDPEALIRDGGHLFLARLHGRIVGTCALLAEQPGVMELSKMSVTDACQGLGIGRSLMDAALAKYVTLGCRRLYLETNSILTPAIRLYESVGFYHRRRPGGPSPYERADVYMVWQTPRVRRGSAA
jgi:GNAT superfamily N-acetyltransferase/DNA-binding MarR family transcriptional regulator